MGLLILNCKTHIGLFLTVKKLSYEKLCDLQDAMPCQWSSSSSGDPASIKASLRDASLTLMLAGLHADLRNIAPARLFFWITAIHKLYNLNDSIIKPII